MCITRFCRAALAGSVLIALSGSLWAAGTLRYATVGEPPSLDQQVITSDLVTTIAHHMFEGLYTFDSKNSPVPLLAESDRSEDDGKTIIITLRQGIEFHDGSDMESADVEASLKRWGEFGSRGGLLFDNVESLEATDDYEVTLQLSAPFGPWKF